MSDASGLVVTPMTLASAALRWEGNADRLDGAWRRLHRTQATVSPDVAAAFETFRETWVDEIKSAAQASQRHSESLVEAQRSYLSVDDAVAERLRAILPWTMRHAEIRPGGALQSPSLPTDLGSSS